MTEPQDDATSYLDALEPAARSAFGRAPDLAAISQAISLRRIADALEQLTSPTFTLSPAVTGPSDLALSAEQLRGVENSLRSAVDNAEGWHDWPGGDKPPVPDDVRVDVRYRDMDPDDGIPSGQPAGAYWWGHYPAGHRADIVAWRLAR